MKITSNTILTELPKKWYLKKDTSNPNWGACFKIMLKVGNNNKLNNRFNYYGANLNLLQSSIWVTDVLIDSKQHVEITIDQFIQATEPWLLWKEGDVIEVRNRENGRWNERIFIQKIEANAFRQFICIALETNNEENYKKGEPFETCLWKYARNYIPPLPTIEVTKEEIAKWKGVTAEQIVIK